MIFFQDKYGARKQYLKYFASVESKQGFVGDVF